MSIKTDLDKLNSHNSSIESSLGDIKSALSDAYVDVNGDLKVSEVASYIKKINASPPPAYLCTGAQFNSAIKKINSSATSIIFTKNNPPAGVTTYNLGVDSVSSTLAPYSSGVVAWQDTSDSGRIYVSGRGQEIIANQDCYQIFFNFNKLTTVDLTNFDSQNVTNMSSMFYQSSGLTSLDVTKLNTQNVTNMSSMFGNCSKLTSLDVTKLNTQNVTSMSSMFYGCSGLTSLNITNFDTQNVDNMNYMFYGCSKLTSLDLSKCDTQNVTTMTHMFDNCSGLTSLNLTNKFNTQKVTTMNYMFNNCSGLTSLNVSNFNTQNDTNMAYMFYGCSKLTSLDLSKFNTQSVTDIGFMFNGCSSLTTIYGTDWTSNSKITASRSVFTNCSNLSGYSSTKITGAYAKPIASGGYFTTK